MDFVESSLLSISRVIEQLKDESYSIKSKVESLEIEMKEMNTKKDKNEPLKRTMSTISPLAKKGSTSQIRSIIRK
jgi:hypothetical protein